MLVFMENNSDVISTLNEIGYGILRWENLPCYASSGTTIGTIYDLSYLSDGTNKNIFSYSSSDITVYYSGTGETYTIYSGGDTVLCLEEFFYYILVTYLNEELQATAQFNSSTTYNTITTSIASDFVNVNSDQFTSEENTESGDSYVEYTDSEGGVYRYTYTVGETTYILSSLTYTSSS